MALYNYKNRHLIVTFFAIISFNLVDVHSQPSIINDSLKIKDNDLKSTFIDQIIQIPFANRIERKYITSSVTSVSGEKLKKINTPFLSNTLFGQLSGLHAQQGGGSPGNTDYPSLFARGRQTFQDNRENAVHITAFFYDRMGPTPETRKKKALDILEKIKSVRYNLGES